MKKFDFKKLALMGITGGVMCATQVNGAATEQPAAEMETKPATPAKMDEAHFMMKLNPDSKATYLKMSPEGKALALKLANQGCKGKNDCKGQNACKTQDNACAGQGGCKGTSPAAFTNMNDAVKVANAQMEAKRAKMNKTTP